jgi:hypothetical protein
MEGRCHPLIVLVPELDGRSHLNVAAGIPRKKSAMFLHLMVTIEIRTRPT